MIENYQYETDNYDNYQALKKSLIYMIFGFLMMILWIQILFDIEMQINILIYNFVLSEKVNNS